MRGYIDTLSDIEGNSDIASKAYSEMSNQVDRMKDLADDIILLSGLESETVSATKQQVNMHQLLTEIASEAEQLALENIRLSSIAQTVTIEAELKMLRSALGNIVLMRCSTTLRVLK